METPNPEVKPDPRLISYLERMPSGVGGYRSLWHLFHKWETIKNDPPHKHQVCVVCGRRRIYPPTQHVGDMICYPDFGWLETGEWTPPTKAIRQRRLIGFDPANSKDFGVRMEATVVEEHDEDGVRVIDKIKLESMSILPIKDSEEKE